MDQFLVDSGAHQGSTSDARLVLTIVPTVVLKLVDDTSLGRRVVGERQVRAPVELCLVLFLLVGRRAPCSLDPFSLFIRVAVVAVCAEVCPVAALVNSISKQGLLHVTLAALGGDPLTLCLRFPHPKFLSDEAVFDHLVDVLFLGEWSLVVEVQISHLLADVLLVDALGMTWVAMVNQTLSDEGPVESPSVRRCCPLLVPSRLDLIFTQEDAFAVNLLEGNVCRG